MIVHSFVYLHLYMALQILSVLLTTHSRSSHWTPHAPNLYPESTPLRTGLLYLTGVPSPVWCLLSEEAPLVGGSTESTLSLNCLPTGRTLEWEVRGCSSGAVTPV